MAGTLDFEEYVIFCPDCGERQEVLVCEDNVVTIERTESKFLN